MPFCEECGNAISSQAKFCSGCGKKVGNISSGAKENIQLPVKALEKENSRSGQEWNASVKAIDSYLSANAPILAQGILSEFLYDPFLDECTSVLEFWKECQTVADGSISPRYMFQELIDRPDVGKIRRGFDSGLIEVAEQPIAMFIGALKERLQPHYNNYSLNNLLPTEHENNSIKNEILTNLRQSSTAFINELGELQQRQKQIQQMQGNILSMLEETNYAPYARTFAGGVMAVAMPMIGIPMLAATFLDHKNKDEKTNQYLEQFWQLLEAYVAQWLETASVLENTRNKQLAYYVPKVTTMLRNAFGKTFEDIAKKGYMIYSPETYFRG